APGRIGDGGGGVIVPVPGGDGGPGGPEPDTDTDTDTDTGREQVVPGGGVGDGAGAGGDDDAVTIIDQGTDSDELVVPGRLDRTPAPAPVGPSAGGHEPDDAGGKLWLLLTGLAGAGAGALRGGRWRA